MDDTVLYPRLSTCHSRIISDLNIPSDSLTCIHIEHGVGGTSLWLGMYDILLDARLQAILDLLNETRKSCGSVKGGMRHITWLLYRNCHRLKIEEDIT